MREKRVGPLGVLSWAGGGSSAATCEIAVGEETVSPDVRSDVCDRIGGLCFCNAAVGGMFVTCLMNVVMAR